MRRIVMFFVAAAVSASTASTCFAQSGSIGGTIGKREKSVSGGTSSPAPQREVHVEPKMIHVISATLGRNCGAPRGNVTDKVTAICNGKDTCSLPGATVRDPDPAFGCAKSFSAEWRCGGGKTHSKSVPPVTFERNVLTLSCR